MQGRKQTIFRVFRDSQKNADLSTTPDNSLICPLCWTETRYEELTLEHVIPGSVGGSTKVLTCRRCNNEHGSSLDAHLAQYQTIADAFKGHGAIPTELNINGKKLVANLKWSAESKTFEIVGKASDPRAQELVREDFKSDLVKEFNVSFFLGYAKNPFQTALLRAAYLVLFKKFGYAYAKHDIVQILRRRICDPSVESPRLGSFIMELRNAKLPEAEPYLLTHGNVDGVPFYFVILRVKKSTTTFFGVYMPHPQADPDKYFQLMEQCSQEYNGKTITIPSGHFFK